MLDINQLMQSLSERRPVFHSEADFQFALAWHIKELMPNEEVRLEYEPLPDEPKRKRLDAWIGSEGLAIELKYPKKELDWSTRDGERYKLTNQSARDQGRFDFVDDIQRLEGILARRCDAGRGIAVLLTNDPEYWISPTRQGWEHFRDAEFRIHCGSVLKGKMDWATGTPDGTKSGRTNPIKLKSIYTMRWQDYSDLDTGKNPRFRYLAVEVRK